MSPPEKRPIVSTGGRAGTPKQEGLAPAFPGTRTLTLWKVGNFSAPDSLSKLAPHTRCPFIQMVSPCPGGVGHAITPGIPLLLVLKPLTETHPRQSRACSSKLPAVCRPRGRAAGRTDLRPGENAPACFQSREEEARCRNGGISSTGPCSRMLPLTNLATQTQAEDSGSSVPSWPCHLSNLH